MHAPAHRLRVVCFNIGGAFVPNRSTYEQQARAWHQLAAFDAEIALVQEAAEAAIPAWVGKRWDVVKGEMGRFGKTIAWGSVVVAGKELKLRARTDLLTDPWLDLLYDYIVLGEVDLPDGQPAVLASVHAPARRLPEFCADCVRKPNPLSAEEMRAITRRPDDPWAADLAFAALGRLGAKRFFFGGDWNDSRLFDLDRACRGRGEPPYSAMFFTRARDTGWFECHGAKNEERSYFPARTETGRPHQLDHLFCDGVTAERMQSCHVRSDWMTTEVSDHAPLVTDFDWDSK